LIEVVLFFIEIRTRENKTLLTSRSEMKIKLKNEEEKRRE